MREVVIASACRTPIGKFGGTLKDVSARALGAIAAKEAIQRAGITPDQIDETVFGCVLQGGLGQNVARQVALDAGIPNEVPAFTLNKVCGSGLRTISLAAQIIKAGDADIILAGGTENMSAAGYALPTGRWGARMNNNKIVDMMVNDGLTDAFNNYHMGITAENVAAQYDVSREDQDKFAVASQVKAVEAIKAGRFKEEIVPVVISTKKGDKVFDTDEYPREGATVEGIAGMKPAFLRDGGTVTAANASGINDAAAAVIVMSKEKAEELGIEYLCTIKGYASKGVDPKIMGVGPIGSCERALEKAGWTVDDLDLIEANEAFAAQSLAVGRTLGFPEEKLNVNGGAIALGHPIGASGCRIFVTLIHEMIKRDAKKGLATLCIGGGQGTTLLVERD